MNVSTIKNTKNIQKIKRLLFWPDNSNFMPCEAPLNGLSADSKVKIKESKIDNNHLKRLVHLRGLDNINYRCYVSRKTKIIYFVTIFNGTKKADRYYQVSKYINEYNEGFYCRKLPLDELNDLKAFISFLSNNKITLIDHPLKGRANLCYRK
jgi:hypothetical protein